MCVCVFVCVCGGAGGGGGVDGVHILFSCPSVCSIVVSASYLAK